MVSVDLLPMSLSCSTVNPSVGLNEKIRHVLYALLPPSGVAMSSGRAVDSGRRGVGVSWCRSLPLNMAGVRLPGLECGAGEKWVGVGLGEGWLVQMTGRDGDGQWGVEAGVCWQGLVDVRPLFGLNWHRLEGMSRDGLVLSEVHEWEALVVAARRSVRCQDKMTGDNNYKGRKLMG